MYYAYILKSLKTGRFYYGSTADLIQRLKSHNYGKVKSTKFGRPWILHYSEDFSLKTDALKREKYFKSIDGYNWLKSQNII